MLQSPEPVDLVVMKSDGGVMELKNCIGGKIRPYTGTRNVKLLSSGQMRCIRDSLIISINGMEVFL